MLCRDTSRGRLSRRLACLRSHTLRAYCNFKSKQAISITLFGRRPNNTTRNERLATGASDSKWELRVFIQLNFMPWRWGNSHIDSWSCRVYWVFIITCFFIFFRDLTFLCGLYKYQISRECLRMFICGIFNFEFFCTITQNAKNPHN